MSGGYFNYKQYQIEEIADEIENIVKIETSPRPPVVKEKHMSAYSSSYQHHGCRVLDRCNIVYNTIEEEHERYKRDENMLDVSDIEEIRNGKGFSAVDKHGIKYEVSERIAEHYYDEDGEEIYYQDYEPETIEEFRKAIKVLREAAVYAQRIDWLLCGDDGEETFHKRLKEELGKLKEQTNETDS
jgi:hypothetical protein